VRTRVVIYPHMRMDKSEVVENLSAGRLRQFFKGMADETRLRILSLLSRRGELCVCDLMRVLEMPQSTVSRHMAYLKNSGWVADRREGIWVHYSLAEPSDCVHEALLKCVRECFGRFARFEGDERKLESLVEEGECCRQA